MRRAGRSRASVGFIAALLGIAGLSQTDAVAAFPGDNGLIVFASDRSGDLEIYTLELGATEPSRLTESPGLDRTPSVSADGRTIVFESDRSGDPEIWTMGIDGSGPTMLTDSPGPDTDPSFSPAGDKIVFISQRDDPNGEIYVMDADGGNAARLTTDDAFDNGPVFSPHGESIAYASNVDGDSEIWLMDVTTGESVNVTSNPASDQEPNFSPGGTSLAFSSDRGGELDIWKMDADGSSPQRLTEDPAPERAPAWSPDGSAVAFERTTPSGTGIYVTDSNGLEEFPITDDGDITPDWGRGVGCTTTVTEGWFEPTQGVWQDDTYFPDQGGKQLVYTGMSAGAPRYEAELPMVAGRRTVLAGIDHSVGGPQPHDRNQIVIRGTSNCTEGVIVAMEFVATQGGGTIMRYRTQPLEAIPLEGPVGAESSWSVEVPAANGLPPKPNSFRFPNAGGYIIRDELVRADAPPLQGYLGIFVQLSGDVVQTRGPRTGFVPLLLTDTTAAEASKLQDNAAKLAARSSERAADYLPIPPIDAPGGGLPVAAIPVQRMKLTDRYALEWDEWADQLLDMTRNAKEQVTLAAAEHRLSGFAELGSLERVWSVVRGEDYLEMGFPRSTAVAVSQKLMFGSVGSGVGSVSHEITHTMPFPWADDEMQAECSKPSYHNDAGGAASGKEASGFHLHNGASEVRSPYGPDGSYMGIGTRQDQCTYRHLVGALQAPPDPPVLLVQGRLARRSGKAIGEILPAYQFDGTLDPEVPGGRWALVLRDSSGAVLEEFSFEPHWKIHADSSGKEVSRDVLAFSYKLPDVAGVARIQLVRDGKVLDVQRYSAGPPAVSITKPAPGAVVAGDEVTVRWSGSDADGDALRYSVLYSSDGGITWIPLAFERGATRLRAGLEPVTDHMVRVIATDGAQSVGAEVSFTSP